jgi:hypothetical protein
MQKYGRLMPATVQAARRAVQLERRQARIIETKPVGPMLIASKHGDTVERGLHYCWELEEKRYFHSGKAHFGDRKPGAMRKAARRKHAQEQELFGEQWDSLMEVFEELECPSFGSKEEFEAYSR